MLANLPAILDKQVAKAKPVEVVSAAVLHAVTAKRPKTRYPPLTGLWFLGRWLPDRWIDRPVQAEFGVPSSGRLDRSRPTRKRLPPGS